MRVSLLLRSSSLALASATLASLTTLASPAAADAARAVAIRPVAVSAKTIRLDGVPKEWPMEAVPMASVLQGSPAKADLSAEGVIGYDETNLYVGVDVTDDVLRAGGDHVKLTIGFGGGKTREIKLYPGAPGKSAARAQVGSSTIAAAKVIEAPRADGWSLEASIPWSALPEARDTRVGLRGALFVYDADQSAAAKNVIGTAPSGDYAKLPAMPMEAEQALASGLLRDKGLGGRPSCNLLVDVVGDSMKERVLAFDNYLVVLGPRYRGGREYFYSDLVGKALSCSARELTGDAKPEIVLRVRVGTEDAYRESLEIYSFQSGDSPAQVFKRDVEISQGGGLLKNAVDFTTDSGKPALVIRGADATGPFAALTRSPRDIDAIGPWSDDEAITYGFKDGSFTKIRSKERAARPAPRPVATTARPMPKPAGPSASELDARILGLYERDKRATHASGHAPRFDLRGDLTGDSQTEHLRLYGRDLVVVGPGFKGGTGYAYLTLAQFAAPADIQSVALRDVTGDGKSDVVVQGVLRAPSGEGQQAERTVLLVYTASDAGLTRAFAAEIGRSLGEGWARAHFAFTPGTITLLAGTAKGWTEQTYPFGGEGPSTYEPLVLPWGAKKALYRFTNGSFQRQE